MCRSREEVVWHTVASEVGEDEGYYEGKGKGKGHPATGRGDRKGSRYVKAPDFRDVRHYKGGRSSAIRTGRLYPRRNPWYSFSEAESTPGHMVPSEGATEKNPQ